MAAEVSVRELKDHLSAYLRRVEAGEELVITSHRRQVARLCALPQSDSHCDTLLDAVAGVHWAGGKPQGGRLRPNIVGTTAAERVLEDRG